MNKNTAQTHGDKQINKYINVKVDFKILNQSAGWVNYFYNNI